MEIVTDFNYLLRPACVLFETIFLYTETDSAEYGSIRMQASLKTEIAALSGEVEAVHIQRGDLEAALRRAEEASSENVFFLKICVFLGFVLSCACVQAKPTCSGDGL